MNWPEFLLYRLTSFHDVLQYVIVASLMLTIIFCVSYLCTKQDNLMKMEANVMKYLFGISAFVFVSAIVLYIITPTKEEYEILFGKRIPSDNRTMERSSDTAD